MDTFEDMLCEAFTSKNRPTQQEDASTDYKPNQFRILGDIPVSASYLHNYFIRLAKRINEHDRLDNLTDEDIEKIFVWKTKVNAVKSLFWVLIREKYPDSSTIDCRGLTILPDWKIGGVLLTDEDREIMSFEQQLDNNPISQILQELFV